MAFYINVKPDDYENVIKVMVNNSDKISELKKAIKSKMKLSAQDTPAVSRKNGTFRYYQATVLWNQSWRSTQM